MKKEIDSVNKIINSETVTKIYDDGLKPVVKESGAIIGTILGFFNHVVLFPIKKLNMKFETKLNDMRDELATKIQEIPEDKRTEPDFDIVGPALEVMKYSFDNNHIREMFENLIANNINVGTKELTHVRFVDIIKNMSREDALLFKNLCDYIDKNKNFPKVLEPKISVGDKDLINPFPRYLVDNTLDLDEFQASISLTNLANLGLIDITFLSYYDRKFYKEMINKSKVVNKVYEECLEEIKPLFEEYKNTGVKPKGLYIEKIEDITKTTGNCGLIRINDFGLNFKKVCLEFKPKN